MTRMLNFLCLPLIALAILLSLFPQANHALFIAINHAIPSKVLWMTITNMGDAVFLGCVLFVVLRKNNRLLTNALLCAALIYYSIKFTKTFFAVLRPEHTAELMNVITLGPALRADNFAMPSGHTASAFMAAVFITSAYKLRGWKLWAIFGYASLVGVSRIAVGVHWPADICAGAVIGIIFGLLFTHDKVNLKHISIHYISLALYLPFIYFAIRHAKHIHSTTALINEGVFVVAGILALVIWPLRIKHLFSKKIL